MRQCTLAATLVAGTILLGACTEAPGTMGPAEQASLSSARRSGNLVDGQHVFTMHGDSAVGALSDAIAAAGGTVLYSMDDIGVVLVSGLSNAAAERVARGKASVAQDVRGQWVPTVLDAHVQAAPTDALDLPDVDALAARPPQMAMGGALQWNMRITDTDDAWSQGKTGIRSVRVAILDTGLDKYHRDQRGLIDTVASRAFVPSKSAPPAPAWQDDHWHGTFVGGIVTSNNFVVAGVAPNVTLVAVKVLDQNGDGPWGAIIAGIYYAASIGVDVINLSLGATFPKNEVQGLVPAFNRAVNYAHARGVLVVAASGNDAEDLQHNGNRVTVPCETGVLTCISATGATDAPAYYTNYGTNAVNNAAPGGDQTVGPPDMRLRLIFSLCSSRSVVIPTCRPPKGSPPDALGGAYMFSEGTSMAAPHVSGLAALLDSQHGGALTGSELLTGIQQGADDLGKPGTDAFYGKGRMNTCRTLPGCIPRPNTAP